MKRSLFLLFLYALLLAFATLIEAYMGTDAAKIIIYHSPVIILLLVGVVASFIIIAIKRHLLNINKRKWSFLFIHGAFIIILSGAFVTHLFSEEGIIHIREGQNTNWMLVRTNKGDELKKLPFSVELKKFILTRYPESFTPSSYESVLIINEDDKIREKIVSVNNAQDIKGYRLFQTSYDPDEKGTFLTVNKDIPGRQITYTGYFLLMVGFILFLTSKNSRLSTLFHKLKELNTLPDV